MTKGLEERDINKAPFNSLTMASNFKIDSVTSSKILSKLKASKPNLHKHSSQPAVKKPNTDGSKLAKDFRITRKIHREIKDPIVLQSFSILKEEDEPSDSKSIR